MPYILADPNSKLNWSFDWSNWLEDGDSVSSRQWTITPLNGTSPETPSLTGDTSDTVTVTGMQVNMIYRLTEHVVTANGVEDDRTIVIRADHR